MIRIIYTENGIAVSDALIEQMARSIIQDHLQHGDITVEIGQELLIDQLRIFVIRGVIDCKDLEFYVDEINDDNKRLIDKVGSLDNYKGMGNIRLGILFELAKVIL